ncbi:MAG: hypothetical protein ACK4M7_00465 [Burkholderiales bacterium]
MTKRINKRQLASLMGEAKAEELLIDKICRKHAVAKSTSLCLAKNTQG